MGKKTNKEINLYISKRRIVKDKKNVATTDKSKILIVDIDMLTDYPK